MSNCPNCDEPIDAAPSLCACKYGGACPECEQPTTWLAGPEDIFTCQSCGHEEVFQGQGEEARRIKAFRAAVKSAIEWGASTAVPQHLDLHVAEAVTSDYDPSDWHILGEEAFRKLDAAVRAHRGIVSRNSPTAPVSEQDAMAAARLVVEIWNLIKPD